MRTVLSLFFGFSVGFGSALVYLVEASDSSTLIKLISIMKGVIDIL